MAMAIVLPAQVICDQAALAKHRQTANEESKQVGTKHSQTANAESKHVSARTKHSQPTTEEPVERRSRHSRRAHHEEDQANVSSSRHGKRSHHAGQETVTAESTTTESHQSRTRYGRVSLRRRGHRKAIEEAQGPHAKKAGAKPESAEAHQEETVRTHENEQLARAYSLYDSGANQRLLGNYSTAVSQLLEARQLFHMSSPSDTSDTHEGADDADSAPPPPKPARGPSPMETLALFELAQAAEGARNYEMSRRSFRECIGLNPKFLPAYLSLSCLEARQGNAEEALRVARQASSLAPGDPRPHSIACHLLEELGLTAEARVEQQKATDLSQVNRVPSPPEQP